jgi:hypothetical protein
MKALSYKSIFSNESEELVNENYRLYFENDQLCVTNGDTTLYLDLNRDIYETYLPDQTITSLPSIKTGMIEYNDQTLVNCLIEILNRITTNKSELQNAINNLEISTTNSDLELQNTINNLDISTSNSDLELQKAINEFEAYNANLSTGITIENGTLKILNDIELL